MKTRSQFCKNTSEGRGCHTQLGDLAGPRGGSRPDAPHGPGWTWAFIQHPESRGSAALWLWKETGLLGTQS